MERPLKQTFFIINKDNKLEAWKEDSTTVDEPPETTPDLKK